MFLIRNFLLKLLDQMHFTASMLTVKLVRSCMFAGALCFSLEILFIRVPANMLLGKKYCLYTYPVISFVWPVLFTLEQHNYIKTHIGHPRLLKNVGWLYLLTGYLKTYYQSFSLSTGWTWTSHIKLHDACVNSWNSHQHCRLYPLQFLFNDTSINLWIGTKK